MVSRKRSNAVGNYKLRTEKVGAHHMPTISNSCTFPRKLSMYACEIATGMSTIMTALYPRSPRSRCSRLADEGLASVLR